jgi:hypothetical protein
MMLCLNTALPTNLMRNTAEHIAEKSHLHPFFHFVEYILPFLLNTCFIPLVPSQISPCAVRTWAQDERPADLHMAQPNVPVSKTGQFPPAKLVRGGWAMQGDHTVLCVNISVTQHITAPYQTQNVMISHRCTAL